MQAGQPQPPHAGRAIGEARADVKPALNFANRAEAVRHEQPNVATSGSADAAGLLPVDHPVHLVR